MSAIPQPRPERKSSNVIRSILLALLALTLSLQVCEVLARVYLKPPLGDRVEILDPEEHLGGDCYPRAGGTKLPLNIATEKDAMTFFGRMARARASWPDTQNGKELLEDLLPMPLSYFRLIREAPLCVIYDLGPDSPRRIIAPPGFRKTYAVLGDSFAFGQGVTDGEAFTSRLAALTGARIRSYAAKGANIPEILAQFDQALDESAALGVSKIVYVYVLNDPFIASDLRARLNILNDLMNVRISAAELSDSRIVRLASRWERRSSLIRAMLRLYIKQRVSRETLEFYRDAHDPKLNYGIVDTFERIASMRERARARGIEFAMVVYPMMLNLNAYPLASAHAHLRELATAKGIPFHDLLPAFERHAGEVLTVHPIDQHPNGRADEIAATETAAFLATLPEARKPGKAPAHRARR